MTGFEPRTSGVRKRPLYQLSHNTALKSIFKRNTWGVVLQKNDSTLALLSHRCITNGAMPTTGDQYYKPPFWTWNQCVEISTNWKDENKTKRGRGWPIFRQKMFLTKLEVKINNRHLTSTCYTNDERYKWWKLWCKEQQDVWGCLASLISSTHHALGRE